MARGKHGRDGDPLDLRPARGHEQHAADGQRALIRNVREHPIDTLLAREIIEAYHHQAAERFLRDWELSQIGSARAASLEPRVDGGRGGDLSSTQSDAISRLNRVMRGLSPMNQLIITALMIGRQGLDAIGARMRSLGLTWPPKHYAGPRVCEALDELAEHYGYLRRPIG